MSHIDGCVGWCWCAQRQRGYLAKDAILTSEMWNIARAKWASRRAVGERRTNDNNSTVCVRVHVHVYQFGQSPCDDSRNMPTGDNWHEQTIYSNHFRKACKTTATTTQQTVQLRPVVNRSNAKLANYRQDGHEKPPHFVCTHALSAFGVFVGISGHIQRL